MIGDPEIELWAAVIASAIDDVNKKEPEYPSNPTVGRLKVYYSSCNSWRDNFGSAKRFFNGKWFEEICEMIGVEKKYILARIR